MPRVLNKKIHGVPIGAEFVGRPTRWGNPFVIGKDGNRSEVIKKFKEWLDARPQVKEQARLELRGKDLVCFCAPEACHADVLLKVANEEDE